MRSKIALLWLAALAPLCSGCLSRQIARDGIGLRQAILDMYTDQVMDNLIRAHNNMPYVQLVYTTIQANDMDQVSANGALDQTITTTRDLFAAMASRVLANDYKAGGMGDRMRTMNFTANPITDQNDIYQRYLDFSHNSDLFVVSDCPPPCAVHIQRKCDKIYYWVPQEAGPAFLDLVLKTTFMRGPEAAPVALAAVDVKIVDVEKVNPVPGRDATNATLLFDKAVPNGPATLIVDLDDGRRVRVGLWPISKDLDGKRVDLGQPTTRLEIQWSPMKDGFTELQLKGRPARFYSHDFPPEAQVPSPILHEISNNLNSIKTQVENQRRN